MTNQGNAPFCISDRHVIHMAEHVIESNMHHSTLAGCHLATKFYDVGMLHGIRCREDRFLER